MPVLARRRIRACISGHPVVERDMFGVRKISGFNVDISIQELGEGSRAEIARDFTINAIYFHVSNNKLRENHGGVRDVRSIILHIG
jgi:hypothetical protein